jgi:hypothetical protein
MPAVSISNISALDIGPDLPSGVVELQDNALGGNASGAVVSGSLVAFAPGVSALHQRDVLQSLLLAQLAANAKAERHKDPVGWFKAYMGVMEQTAWVVEASTSTTRYLPETSTFSAGSVVNHVFRSRVTPEELGYVAAAVNAFRSDVGGLSQLVFECPSHSGGIGNFQVALAAEEDGVLGVRIVQVSFNAPKHVTQLMLEEFTNTAKFQVGFLALTQNEEVYATVRSSIAAKVESRFQGSVALFELP